MDEIMTELVHEELSLRGYNVLNVEILKNEINDSIFKIVEENNMNFYVRVKFDNNVLTFQEVKHLNVIK